MTRLAMGLLALSAVGVAPEAIAVEQDTTASGESEANRLDTVEVRGARKSGYTQTQTSTATRTPTLLRDVPQSISVITPQQLRDQAVQSMADAVRYVPGIGSTQGEGNRDGLVFRGNSSTADLFVDGMRDDVQYYRDTYNIDRIEAFRGPNAMIFGRGSPGGLLNRVTKVAGWDPTRRLDVQIGTDQKQRLTADIGHAPNPTTALRVTGLDEDSGSFRDGVELRRRGINPTVAIRAGDSTRIEAGYEFFVDERTADRGVPSDPRSIAGTRRPLPTDRATFFGDPTASPSRTQVRAGTVFVEHRLGDGIALRSRLRHADYDKFYQNVFPGAADADSVVLSAYNNASHRDNLFNQTDLEIAARTGAIEHTLLAGIELGRQHSANLRQSGTFDTPAGAPCLAGSTSTTCRVPLARPTVSVPVTYRNNSVAGTGDARNTSSADIRALYAQDQIVFSPRWQAIVGLRYERFDLDFRDQRAGVSAQAARLTTSDSLWSPRAGLVYSPLEPVSLYASFGVTHLPRSGEQLTSLAPNLASLRPETFRNYEIGAKWTIAPQLDATAALYRLERRNAAVSDPTDPARMLLLDGDSQRIEGLELSLAGHLTERWQVIGSFARQDARTVQAVGAIPAGRVLPQTPRHSAGLWNRYDFSPRWGAGLGAIHRGDSYASISNAVTLPGYTRLDGALYFTLNARIGLQLNVENLLGVHYYPVAHNDNNISPGAPRGAQLSLALDF